MADTYFATVTDSAAAANKRHMAIYNGTGSGKVLVIYRIVAIPSPPTITTGKTLALAAVRLTSAPTGGTPVTLTKSCPANITGGRQATPNPPAQLIFVREHTAGTTEGSPAISAFGLGVANPEETASPHESTIYDAPIDGSEQVMCPEGWGFEIRQLALASDGAISLQAIIGLLNPAATL